MAVGPQCLFRIQTGINLTDMYMYKLTEVGVGSRRGKHRLGLLGGGPHYPVRERELQAIFVELCCADALAILGRNGSRADDLDRLVAGAMAPSHVVIHAVDRRGEGGAAVLAVHIVRSAPRVVFNPDAKVLDVPRVLLSNLGRGVSYNAGQGVGGLSQRKTIGKMAP